MTQKIEAAIRYLHRRDRRLAAAARKLAIRAGATAVHYNLRDERNQLTVGLGRVVIRPRWLRRPTEHVAYSIGWAAFYELEKPYRGLRKVGAFANRDSARNAEIAVNLAGRRHLDVVFGYRDGRRPFEQRPFEDAVRSRSFSLGEECCDDATCIFTAMTSDPPISWFARLSGKLHQILGLR